MREAECVCGYPIWAKRAWTGHSSPVTGKIYACHEELEELFALPAGARKVWLVESKCKNSIKVVEKNTRFELLLDHGQWVCVDDSLFAWVKAGKSYRVEYEL